MNPTKELTRKLCEAEFEGKSWKRRAEHFKTNFEKLSKEHGDLIDTNLKLENCLNELDESREEFCKQCELEATLICRGCTLHKFL